MRITTPETSTVPVGWSSHAGLSPLRTLGALAATELRLHVREWGLLVFGLAFPPLMLLILAGVFAEESFAGMQGNDFYVISYLAVPAASLGLTGLPVQVAGYREHGVLKRFAASGISSVAVVFAQAVATLLVMVVAAGIVLGVAAVTYGIPAPSTLTVSLAVLGLGMLMLLTIGVALGLATTSVRVANAVGLLVFFPTFLLGGGGPPLGVMPATMRDIADLLPLTPVTSALRHAWLTGEPVGADVRSILIWWSAAALAVAVLTARYLRTGR